MSSHLQDAAMQLAETVQTAHINRHPSAEHDLAPSTAADQKEPVRLTAATTAEEKEDEAAAGEDEVPLSLLEPPPRQSPRRPAMPPLPDLRFEQSYLASIKLAEGWQAVAYITVRDQVVMPLVQGLTWTLLVAGWRHWNGAAKFGGQTVGARIRRWWWGVNGWKVPRADYKGKLNDEKVAEGIVEFYTAQSSVGGD